MSDLDKKIAEHSKKSKILRNIYWSNEGIISYQKSVELQKQQDEEYKKMMFFKNLKKEMVKSNERD